ncbi:flagellar hook-length control protein FliK [Rhizobium daejeonense]
MMNVVNTAAKATSEMVSMTGAGGKTSQASGGDAFSKTLNAFDGEKPPSSGEGDAKGASQAAAGDVSDASEKGTIQGSPLRDDPESSEADLASLSEKMTAGQPVPQTETAGGKSAVAATEKPGANSQKLAEIAAALAMSTTDGGVTDTKALAAALKKLADSAKSDAGPATDSADETLDNAPADTSALDDMLSLLSLPLAGGQTDQTTAAAGELGAAQQGVINGVGGHAAGAKVIPDQAGQDAASGDDASSTESGAVFRFQKSDSAASVDMYVAPGTDGSVDVDVSTPAAKDAPVVQVVDSRRYLGLAPNSNALSVASTIANDPQWAGALDPASKLANSALFASTGNVVHTLKIQMNPVELGNVTATMRLVGEDLSIHLTVHSSSAYRELTHDSNSIMDALKAQGFSVDQISVSLSSSSDKSGDNAAGGRQPSDMGQSQQQQGNRQSGGDARQAEQFDRTSSGSGTAGGNDAGMVEGAVASGAGSARPEHVYL